MCSVRQEELKQWLCDRIGLVPTPDIRLIGSVRGDRILGVVGFDGYNGASLQMHVAGEQGWLTRDLIWATFDYAFNVCNVSMIMGLIPSGNSDAIRFNTKLGFKTELVLDGAHPDGSLWLMTMRRRECRFLHRESNGQEIRTSTGT